MKYLIILLLVLGCNETTTDPSVSQLSADVNTLRKEVNKLNALQTQYASQADITNNQNEIADIKETMEKSLETINKLITIIDNRIDAISLPDTVKQYIGDGNLIYYEKEGKDTVHIIINDTVRFEIWKTGEKIK